MREKLAALMGRHRAKIKTQRVMVASISGNHEVNSSITSFAAQVLILSEDESNPFLFGYEQVDGESPQELARNIACGHFLKGGSRNLIASREFRSKPPDVLVMIDNDMIVKGWPTWRFLYTEGYDIVAPIEYMWRPFDPIAGREPDAFPCAFRRNPDAEIGHIAAYPTKDGPRQEEVDRVGSGCVAIKRRVLEDPKMLLAPDMDPPAFWRNIYALNGRRLKGLDIDFCDRAKELGYKIMVDWNAEVGHQKTVNLNDVDMYAKR